MKTYSKIWILLAFLFCLTETNRAQNNVWISGKLLTDQKEGMIDVSHEIVLTWPQKPLATTIVDKYGNFKFQFNITKPQVVQIFNKKFYVQPGDSIIMDVTGTRFIPEKFDFKGKNRNNYLYSIMYDSLAKANRFKYYGYDFKNGLDSYLIFLTLTKNILLKNLDEFSQQHPLTPDFKLYAFTQIVFEFYDQMLIPITRSKKFTIEQIPPSYSAALDNINLTEKTPAANQEQIIKANILHFAAMSSDLYDKMEYAYTAKDLLRYKMLKSTENELQVINKNFSGLTKEYLLNNYARSLIQNYNSKDSTATKNLFKKIDVEIKSAEFRKLFNGNKAQLNKAIIQMPKDVMLTNMIDSAGHKLTFKDLMVRFKNKVIVLDFWASWCGACIQRMPDIVKLRKNFSNMDVEFLFLSIDEKMSDWKGGMQSIKIPGNHFWIVENKQSELVKYLELTAIPRYTIINQSGRIEKLESGGPSPDENGLMVQISKLLNH